MPPVHRPLLFYTYTPAHPRPPKLVKTLMQPLKYFLGGGGKTHVLSPNVDPGASKHVASECPAPFFVPINSHSYLERDSLIITCSLIFALKQNRNLHLYLSVRDVLVENTIIELYRVSNVITPKL